jgi:hypothetical protein
MKIKGEYTYKILLTNKLDIQITIYQLQNGKWKEKITKELPLGRMSKIDVIFQIINGIKEIEKNNE